MTKRTGPLEDAVNRPRPVAALRFRDMTVEPEPKPITPEELGDLFTFNADPEAIAQADGIVTVWALAWFPKDEWAKAIVVWPELLSTMPEDHAAYCLQIESHLRASAAAEPGSPDVAPLSVDELIAEYGDEAGELRSRGTMGANIARSGGAISWPPSRNDACWCQSGRKYKNCCGL